MSTSDTIQTEGIVRQILPDRRFRIELDNGEEALATIAGRFRRNVGRLLEEDRVLLELSPYDLGRGRIVGREETGARPK